MSKRLVDVDYSSLNELKWTKFLVEGPIRTLEDIEKLNPDNEEKDALLKGVSLVSKDEKRFQDNPKYMIDFKEKKIKMIDYCVFKEVSKLSKSHLNSPVVKRCIPYGSCVGLKGSNFVAATIRPPGQKMGGNGLGTFGFFNTIAIELIGKEYNLYSRIQQSVEDLMLKEAGLFPGEYLWTPECVCHNDYPELDQYEIIIRADCKFTYQELKRRIKYNKAIHPKERLFKMTNELLDLFFDNDGQGATAHLYAIMLALGMDTSILSLLDYELQDPTVDYKQNLVELFHIQ